MMTFAEVVVATVKAGVVQVETDPALGTPIVIPANVTVYEPAGKIAPAVVMEIEPELAALEDVSVTALGVTGGLNVALEGPALK
jgi:hypothetical protein